METRHELDSLDKKILQLISQNARVPFLEVARECNVSGAAIHQRVQKLVSSGIIKGSEFIIDTYKIGYQTCAFIGITVKDNSLLGIVVDKLRTIPEIVECHYTTGKSAIFVKIYAIDNKHLLNIVVDKISTIDEVANAETMFISLDQHFSRQISVSDDKEEKNETTE